MCLQTVLGLQHMHQKGILHRDIKSLNLLLDANRQIKIADLGIATVRKLAPLLLLPSALKALAAAFVPGLPLQQPLHPG